MMKNTVDNAIVLFSGYGRVDKVAWRRRDGEGSPDRG